MSIYWSVALLIVGTFLSFMSFAALALSQGRHAKRLIAGTLSAASEKRLRRTGWIGLAGALFALILRDGASFGLALWFVLNAAMILIVALLLTYRLSVLRPVARVIKRLFLSPQ